MPLYEYECTQCGHRTELLQRFGDPPLDKCPECGAAVRKLFSAPAVQFKGTGWYVTDYGGKGKKPASPDGSDGGGKKDSKGAAGDGSGGKQGGEAKKGGGKQGGESKKGAGKSADGE